ncbi:ABC transporter ATP-binding protein [Nocardioides glacieisoli]|uniref:ABC transporter ATP-binding protein n=1 Tax=Nocardioides glacieisoli TaxID=1168730 RepID=A0A4V1RKH1_9ACTN|nr:ABC transporter ATP-binding protein [Nocardioides glacieisoli]RYB92262.1 ABC transporter ATP-binding protein [Nocardioides glacieisoli]
MVNGELVLESLTKSYDDQVAVDHLDLWVEAGEFFSILGPSGCGKSTTLKMIGGFVAPTSGRVFIDGKDVTDLPPNKRAVNTVFQNYALFPFLTVRQNVAFGLRRARVGKQELNRRVDEVLELVELSTLGHRRPSELSGGQQQRAALARALVLRPDVLLLDEPLSALDAKMRRQLQVELKELHRQVGTTFVYITHDQEEAMTMSDRIAVLQNGRLEQVDVPSAVYERPETPFVTQFMGISNMIRAGVDRAAEGWVARFANAEFAMRGSPPLGSSVDLSIRPERVRVSGAGSVGSLSGAIVDVSYLGAATHYLIELDANVTLQAAVPNDGVHHLRRMGEKVSVHLSPEDLRVVGEDQVAESPVDAFTKVSTDYADHVPVN